VVAILDALAVALLLPRSTPLVTSYAMSSRLASALDLMAGFALLGAGVIAWHERLRGALAPLTVLMAVVWFAPDWIGWEDGSRPARSLAMIVVPFGFALVLHTSFAAPRGRVPQAPARAVLALAYLAATVAALGPALVRDPFEDPYCWSNCSVNVFLVHAAPNLAHALGKLGLTAALSAGVLTVIVVAWRLGRATGPGRRTAQPVLLPAAVVGAAGAAYAAALLRTPLEDPARAGFAVLFGIRAIALVALAGGVAWMAVRARRTRATVAQVSLQRASGLQEVLARALGDPNLLVAYPLSGSEMTVDANGAPVAPGSPGPGRTITRIERRGEPVAIVAHDASLLDGPGLEREIGAAARLAVDNERLQASVRAHLGDLRASRIRIIETGDATRRRLERDLHDGAQQRMLALSYELRLALAEARTDGDEPLVALLGSALDETRDALEELRALAHGIHPAILAEAGLESALATAADTAPIPVDLGEITHDRYPETTETAAYLLAVAGIGEAAARGATHASVEVVRHPARLVVRVADDGDGPRRLADHLADRVGALGGRVDVDADRLQAEIPCA
jgi:signal transduction histidine kinase